MYKIAIRILLDKMSQAHLRGIMKSASSLGKKLLDSGHAPGIAIFVPDERAGITDPGKPLDEVSMTSEKCDMLAERYSEISPISMHYKLPNRPERILYSAAYGELRCIIRPSRSIPVRIVMKEIREMLHGSGPYLAVVFPKGCIERYDNPRDARKRVRSLKARKGKPEIVLSRKFPRKLRT